MINSRSRGWAKEPSSPVFSSVNAAWLSGLFIGGCSLLLSWLFPSARSSLHLSLLWKGHSSWCSSRVDFDVRARDTLLSASQFFFFFKLHSAAVNELSTYSGPEWSMSFPQSIGWKFRFSKSLSTTDEQSRLFVSICLSKFKTKPFVRPSVTPHFGALLCLFPIGRHQHTHAHQVYFLAHSFRVRDD